jgi:hypothetical protein
MRVSSSALRDLIADLCVSASLRLASSQPEKALHRYVFVETFPVDAKTATKELPIVSLPRCRFKEARIPIERHSDLPTVSERDLKLIAVTGHIDGQRLNIDR